MSTPEYFGQYEEKVSLTLAPTDGNLENLFGGYARKVMDRIVLALKKDYGDEKAEEIAFHLSDWSADAAFIVALHLHPERFTLAEIEEAIGYILIHAPNHLIAAAALAGHDLQDIWDLGAEIQPADTSP